MPEFDREWAYCVCPRCGWGTPDSACPDCGGRRLVRYHRLTDVDRWKTDADLLRRLREAVGCLFTTPGGDRA